jgi:hypothetical protein
MADLAFIERVLAVVRALHASESGATFEELYQKFPTRTAEVPLAVTALRQEGRVIVPGSTAGEHVRIVPL